MSTRAEQDGAPTALPTAEAVLEPDGLLPDAPESERVRHGEELEIEGELLHDQERQHLLRDLAPEYLEPDLGVANVEAEEDAGRAAGRASSTRRERG